MAIKREDKPIIRDYLETDRSACLSIFESNVGKYFDAKDRAEFDAFLTNLPDAYLEAALRGSSLLWNRQKRAAWCSQHTFPLFCKYGYLY